MVLNFLDYNLINESKTLKEFERLNSRGFIYQQIYDGFKGKGYEYYGTVTVEYDSDGFCPDGFLSVIPEDILGLAKKYAHKSKYLSFTPDNDGVSIKAFDGAMENLIPMLGDGDVEKINACMKGKELYFVLFNKEKRYFYFMNINSKRCRHWLTGYVELWLKVRTTGVDEIRKELNDIDSNWEK